MKIKMKSVDSVKDRLKDNDLQCSAHHTSVNFLVCPPSTPGSTRQEGVPKRQSKASSVGQP